MDPLQTRLQDALRHHYLLDREIGRGGMAVVYLASDLKHDRRVAIKLLNPQLVPLLGAERFLREIRIAAKLTHPNILPLHDSGEAQGLLYYVMPYIEGESLRDRLTRERRLALEEATQVVRNVAAALSYAHTHGVIHRDIKPENILLADRQAIVADFGIARALDAAGSERLTTTGMAVGTPAYMSPEQGLDQGTLDGRTDIYSLGCVTYEMLSGTPPFAGRSAQAVMAGHATAPPPSLRALRPELPKGVEDAVHRALAKAPEGRFPTADEFAATLTHASTAEAVAVERGRTRRARMRWAVALAAGAVVVAAGVWKLASLAAVPAIRRFAVLPFDNPVVDSAQAYFEEGMHEAVISDLADEGLGVIARTSVLQYHHSKKPIREIARELGVDALVETSLSRTPDSVTVQARLVDGRSQQYLWSSSFGASFAEVPALAVKVARGIAAAIAPRKTSRPLHDRPVDPQVYDDYLKGRSYLHRPPYIRSDLETAREYFERAIARDSSYAPAWAGIAGYWTVARQRGYFTAQAATPPSEAAAYKAVALDSTLAEAHGALASAKLYGEWDWHGAEQEFRRAIALQPDNAGSRAFYAHLLLILHRPEEALQQMTLARQLDPLDPLLLWINGLTFTGLGRYDDAMALYREALARSPKHAGATFLMWQTFDFEGRFRQADSALQEWAETQDDSGLATAVSAGRQRGGYLEAVRAGADYLVAHEPVTYDPWGKAVWYATAHDDDKALVWLERSFEQRDPAMPYLGAHPRFNQLHRDPRFQALVRKMHLPD